MNLTNESKSDEDNSEKFRELILMNKFDRNLVDLIKSIKDRLKIKWDCVAVIDGEEGSGKSSLAMILGFLLDPKFDLDKNVSYLPLTHEVEDKFYAIKSEQVLVVDEAIKALYKLRFMDKMQARINTMYATERKQRKITLLCIPRFTDLNEFFRNDRVQFWIHVVDRGVAVAFVKDKVNIFGSDRWHMKEEYKRICLATYKKKFSEITIPETMKMYEKSNHFWFAFTFPPMPKEVEDAYLETREKYNALPDKVDKVNASDRVEEILNMRHDKNLEFTNEEIGRMAGCSQTVVDRAVKRWKRQNEHKLLKTHGNIVI